jgi:hypothetical protein
MPFGDRSTNTDLSALSAALDWVRSLGIRVAGTRHQIYYKLIKATASGTDAANRLYREDPDRYYNAVLEAYELIGIHDQLAGKFDAELREKIARAQGGAENAFVETKSSGARQARDYAFELSTLAMLVGGGLKPDFRFESDAAVNLNGVPLLIECKRPTSIRKLPRDLKDAWKQLETTFKKHPATPGVGLVALDLTHLLNISSQPRVFEWRAQLEAYINGKLTHFVGAHSMLWKPHSDIWCLGTLCSTREIALVPRTHGNNPHICQVHVLAEAHEKNLGELHLTASLMSRVRPPWMATGAA